MLLRKQTSYNERFRASLAFSPRKVGYEAGIALWGNQYSYATVGVTRVALKNATQGLTIVFRAPTGQAGSITVQVQETVPRIVANALKVAYPLLERGGTQVESLAEVSERGELELAVECRPTAYKLSISGGSFFEAFEVAAASLTVAPPVGASFAGVMYGIYSFAKGEPALDPADFSEIEVRDI